MGQNENYSARRAELLALLLAGRKAGETRASEDASSITFTPVAGCLSVFATQKMTSASTLEQAARASSREKTACQLVIDECNAVLAKSGTGRPIHRLKS